VSALAAAVSTSAGLPQHLVGFDLRRAEGAGAPRDRPARHALPALDGGRRAPRLGEREYFGDAAEYAEPTVSSLASAIVDALDGAEMLGSHLKALRGTRAAEWFAGAGRLKAAVGRRA